MPSHQQVESPSQASPMAATAEPNRNSKYDPKKPHITDLPITKENWYKHVNWLNVSSKSLSPAFNGQPLTPPRLCSSSECP